VGHIYADITCLGPNGKQAGLRLLVDTGASYTWLPRRLLESLGVTPTRTMSFDVGDNRSIRRRVGELVVGISGFRATTVVVFAGKNDANVIGQNALLGLALEVDPRRERLRPAAKMLFYPAMAVA